MSDRYFAKVVKVIDDYLLVIDKGEDQEVFIGQNLLVVGLGDIITDPDTNEEIERLEIVKGKAVVSHVQSKISTIKSNEYEKTRSIREIEKVTSRGGLAIMMPQESVTETIKPGEKRLIPFNDAKTGDQIIKI